tara:strand:+ start:72 stop:665 length:594 start_codon:yes stop_codon:yes gene_type:complete
MINKEYFFPTCIYLKDIPNAEKFNEDLTKHIIEWKHADKGLNKTNMNGWHSQTDMHTKPEYQGLVKHLQEMQIEIFQEEHLESEPLLGNMWANVNPPGGYNRSHLHPNSFFSGVYYIKAPKNSGALKLIDPRPGAQVIMPRRKPGELPPHFWRDVNYAPLDGRIIMFPAWIWHEVETNMSAELRISVSFNFIQKGFE